MSQVSYGTITINDLTDITDVYLEYALVSDTITRAEDIPSSTQWSTTYPTWVSGQQIWIRRVTRKEGIDTPEYGTPYLDKAVSQIQNNYIGLSNKLRTFFYPGDSTYSGAFAVSKTSTDGLNTANANTYGFNTRVASALISMGYNKIPLLEMGLLGSNFNGIKLYSPILTNNVITGNRLDATLTSEGLKLLKGGIEAGTFNSNDYIYVWSNDDNNHAIKIGNSSNNKNDWRIIAGNKFGVDKAGNLYANNADITGAITATSLTIGSGSTSYDGILTIEKTRHNAESALTQLSTVESTVGINNWTSKYGNFIITDDIQIDLNKTYYRQILNYIKTADSDILIGKKYYTRNGEGTDESPYIYTEVTTPVVSELDNYYEISLVEYELYPISEGNPKQLNLYELSGINEGITDFIDKHLVLDSDGLWVIENENNPYQVFLTTDGLYFYGPGGVISKFGENIEFSADYSQKIGGDKSYIEFDSLTNKLYITTDELHVGASNIKDTIDDHQTQLEKMAGYVDINPVDSYIRVGKRDTNSYVQIDGADAKVIINVGGNDVAYMSGDRFYAPSAVVTNLYMKAELGGDELGEIGWVMRSNKHLSLKRLK